MVVRTISTVWRSVMARVNSRGAVPNTSVEMACGVSGCRNHSVKAAIPACATRPIQERFSGGIARYHGSFSSMRAIAFAASLPADFSSRRRVAGCGWASFAGSGTGQDCLIGTATCRAGSTVGTVISVRYADDRYPGGDPSAGIESSHAFSFGPFYDPDNLRFGAVIACNEERLAPGAGFDEHPHSHTEIVTWVVEGQLTHRDSAGNATLVRPGDVQRLSAGGGVRHVERNDGEQPLVFVQMWLAPLAPGGDPRYEIVHGIADSTPYALPEARAMLHVRRLKEDERSAVPDAAYAYLHVVRGLVVLAGVELGPGDSARITDSDGLELTALTPAEVLIWELGS